MDFTPWFIGMSSQRSRGQTESQRNTKEFSLTDPFYKKIANELLGKSDRALTDSVRDFVAKLERIVTEGLLLKRSNKNILPLHLLHLPDEVWEQKENVQVDVPEIFTDSNTRLSSVIPVHSHDSILRSNHSMILTFQDECFEIKVLRITHNDIQQRGGKVRDAIKDILHEVHLNNSNANVYHSGEVRLYPQWNIVSLHGRTLNAHDSDLKFTKPSMIAYEQIDCRLPPIADLSKIQIYVHECYGSEGCKRLRLSRVNTVGSSVFSGNGYSADYDDQFQTEQRAKILRKTPSSLPVHLQQPISFAWELSDSDGSKEGCVVGFSSAENTNTERDYTVVVVKKRKLLSKKDRNALRKERSRLSP